VSDVADQAVYGSITAGNHYAKLTYLEACRGIASIIVMLNHWVIAFSPWMEEQYPVGLVGTPFMWMINGSASVAFFFVLSGYVLTIRPFQTPSAPYLAGAAVKRLPRLMLPAAVTILAGYVILKFSLNHNVEASAVTGSQWLRDFGNAYHPAGFEPTLASALAECVTVFFRGYSFHYNSNLWTMKAELSGSLLVFMIAGAIMFPIPRAAKRAIFVASLVVSYVALNKLFPFVAGAYIAFTFGTGTKAAPTPWIGYIAIVASLLCFSAFSWPDIHTVGAILLIVALLRTPSAARHLSGRVGLWLGKFSFPIYLVHMLVLVSASSYGFKRVLEITGDHATAVIASAAITLVVTVALAIPLVFLDTWWVRFLNRLVKHATTSLSSRLATA
jgi:peptidoglycan/LPS O-acetylase OafA/YrhL